MRYVIAALFALALLAAAPSAQAQYCWDTVCAAGTPAADCWRAYCSGSWSWPTYAPSYSAWSYPTYTPQQTYRPTQLYIPSSTPTQLYIPGSDYQAPTQPSWISQWLDSLDRADAIRREVRQQLNYYR